MVRNLLSKNFGLLFGFFILLSPAVWAQYSLSTATYSQTFDNLPSTGTATAAGGDLGVYNAGLSGWFFAETGSGSNTTLTAGTGTGTGGDTYSFGAASATERALGSLQSGSVTPVFGFYFTNDTGRTINDLTINYTGEQWRLGTAGREDRLDFQYSLDATSLTTGTWTDQNALDFVAPITVTPTGALNGNATANRTAKTYTFTNIGLAAGAKLFIRWSSFDASGADDGLAVDDFSLTATLASTSQVVTPVISATGTANGTDTFWENATVTLSSTTPGSTIYYTTDGSTPTASSNVYSAPFVINTTSTVQAFATASDLTDSAVATKSYTITQPASATFPYSEAFNNTLGAWSGFAVTGARPWTATTTGAYANGYNVSPSVESWLVSPKFTGVSGGVISFDYTVPYTGASLEILYSTNFNGYSAPSTATWNTLTTIPGTTAVTTVTNTGNIQLPVTGNVHIAFKYTGTTGAYSAYYIKNFLASAAAPAISTTQVTTTVSTITSATSGGTISYANGTVSQKGVVWNTAANPTIALSTKTENGAGSGSNPDTFSSTLTPLISNTLYYYRAYATNQNGTAYGTEYSFTTRCITPGAPVVSSPNSTTLGVSIVENGNNATSKYSIRINGGIYTNQFVQADGSINGTEVFQTATEWGTSITVSGLAPETAYTFDSRARNTATALTDWSATSVGTTTESTVPALVLVSSSLDFGDICLNANNTGSFSFTGDNLSAPANITVQNTDGYTYSLTETGTYTSTLTIENYDGSEITVWVRLTPTVAQSYNGTISLAGEDANITAVLSVAATGNGINTPGTATTNSTVSEEITSTTAILYGTATTACSEITGYGFEYSTTSGFTSGTVVAASNLTNGSYSTIVAGLNSGTTYYYKAYIIDGAGTHYGTQLSFTTQSIAAPVTIAATNIGQTSFTANWTPVEGAVEYRLDVSQHPNFGTGTLATDLFFSEYVEGSSTNKYLEIYNGTGHAVDLSDYRLRAYFNGDSTITTSLNDVQLSGILQPFTTIVYKGSGSALNVPSAITNSTINFNGDDAMVLYKISTDAIVDIFGRVGEDPGSAWTSGSITTVNKTLRRKSSVTGGVTVNPASGFPTLSSEWDMYDQDDVSGLGSHTFDFTPLFVTGYRNLAVSAGTSAVVTGLTDNTTYYYKVRAVSDTQTSADSNTTSVTTLVGNVQWTIAEGETVAAWVPAVTPDSTINVTINSPYNTEVNGGFTSKDLTLNNGSTLTIEPATTVVVYGNLVNNGDTEDFIVKNEASLVQYGTGTATGAITVRRNSNELYRLDYTLWSSPVNGSQTMEDFSPATSSNRFYEYRYGANSNNVLLEAYFSVAPTATFTPANAYLIRMPNIQSSIPGYITGDTATIFHGNFEGTANTGTITHPLNTEANRYTGIGNPYPSPIGLADFFAGNSTVLQSGAGIYLWRKKNDAAANSYATLTLSGLTSNGTTNGGQEQEEFYSGDNSTWTLSPGQGFIVRTAEGLTEPSITFTNSMRKNAGLTGQAFFRQSAIGTSRSRYWLNFTNASNTRSQMAVAYLNGATTGIDFGYDGTRFRDGNLALYTLVSDTELNIQARPEFDSQDIVPAGYYADAAGTYTISIDHKDGVFANGQEIYLIDNATGIVTNLSNENYSFTTEAGTFNSRFELRYTNQTLGTDTPVIDSNAVAVYKTGTTININTGSATMSNVTIYDIRGRKLLSENNINNNEAVISNLQAEHQVIIVEIATNKGKVSKKIIF